ncbi:phenylalanine--tRNA ligase subunit beta [Candidatus Woesearchaeota archaeon]|nr:phenylalanine--tRNA ligase subunit beta [Candidatus Woesearchaeota archaeon]
MPTVTLSRKAVESIIGKKLSVTELKDRISMLGTGLEHIDDNEIIVEVFPNRPDMLSEQGFARALSSFLGIKTGLKKYSVKKSGLKIIVDKSVVMRPYTVCAIVKNLSFTDERIREVMQVQEKLSTTHGRNRKKSEYGIYPLEKIKFPVTYVAKDPETVTFQPLGFDKAVLASMVPDHHPKGRAYKHLTVGWKDYPFFIDAEQNVLSMLPFTNSHDTGKIDRGTKDVFIECTGIDIRNVSIALNILATMLADMGGTIYSIEIIYPHMKLTTPDLMPQKMKLNLPYINRLLGLNLKHSEARSCLERMGYGSEGQTVLIPAYRADILHQCDLLEDIGIAYGYEHILEEIPCVATIAEEWPINRFITRLVELLIGAGFQETKSFHLLSHDELSKKMNSAASVVPLRNALVDYGCVRNSIIPSLLKVLAQNQHNDYPQNIFEVGTAFHPDKNDDYGVSEKNICCIALCHEKTDFTTIRQVVDIICRAFDIKCTIREHIHPSFIEGRTAQATVNNHQLAIFGELHPQVLGNFNLSMPVAAAEIDVDALFEVVKKH